MKEWTAALVAFVGGSDRQGDECQSGGDRHDDGVEAGVVGDDPGETGCQPRRGSVVSQSVTVATKVSGSWPCIECGMVGKVR